MDSSSMRSAGGAEAKPVDSDQAEGRKPRSCFCPEGRFEPTDNSAQWMSHSYLLPVDDKTFLLSDEMVHRRLRQRARSVTGEGGAPQTGCPLSARIERLLELAAYYERARECAHMVSLCGGALWAGLGCGENVIATGGGPGIMGSANCDAFEVGAPSIGFNIGLPQEQEPNPYLTPELTFEFHYCAMRKMHLAMRANALAVFPGGYGTLGELFEILALLQTRKAPPARDVPDPDPGAKALQPAVSQ